MAAGDILNPKRPRYQSNERFDQVDAEAMSEYPRGLADTMSKAMLIAPPAATAAATGTIMTGCILLPNPTSSSDGKVRLTTDLSIALDADGRFLVKPTGTTLDATLPTGPSQIYLYYVEASTDNAVRRFISNTSPFSESANAMDTSWQGNVGIYVRAGSIGSAVASDVVNGVTTSLVLIGIATNTSGTVAIDLSGIVNRLTTVKPLTAPASSTANGAAKTLHDLILASLYGQGASKFRYRYPAWAHTTYKIGQRISNGANSYICTVGGLSGTSGGPTNTSGTSTDGAVTWLYINVPNLPGTSAPAGPTNNYGAYATPRVTLDEVDRNAYPCVTIGDGVSSFGTFDLNAFPSADLCLQAAVDSVLTYGGGKVIIRAGVFMTLAGNVTVNTPNGEHLEIIGEGLSVRDGGYQFASGGNKIIHASTVGMLTLRNLNVQTYSTFLNTQSCLEVIDCFINNLSTNAAAIVSTGALKYVRLDNTVWLNYGQGTGAIPTYFAFCDFSGYTVDDLVMHDNKVTIGGPNARSGFVINAGKNVRVIDNEFFTTYTNSSGTDLGSTVASQPVFLKLITAGSTNTTDTISGRIVRGNSFRGSSGTTADFMGIWCLQTDAWEITGNHFARLKFGIGVTRTSGTYNWGFNISNNRFQNANTDGTNTITNTAYGIYALNAGFANSKFNQNNFFGARFHIEDSSGSATIIDAQMLGCTFTSVGQAYTDILWQVQGAILDVVVDGNVFHGTNVDLSGGPILFQGTTYISNFSFSSNKIYSNYQNSTLNANLGFRFNSNVLQSITANGNSFDNINYDSIYTGSSSSNQRLMEFNGQNIYDVTVNGNTGTNVGVITTRSGSTTNSFAMSIVHFSGVDRSYGSNTLVFANVSVDGNTFGQDNANNFFVLVTTGENGACFAPLGSVSVSNNRISTSQSQTSGWPNYGGLCNFYFTGSVYSTPAGHIHIHNNNVWVRNVGTTYTQMYSVISISRDTAGMRVGGIHISGNSFECYNGTWTGAGNGGIFIDMDFGCWVFSKNTATRLGSNVNLSMYILINFTYNDTARQLPPIVATGGNYMTDCVGIQRP